MSNALERTFTFSAVLFRIEGPGGWTFAPVPPEVPLPEGRAWGRIPVTATVDGHTWATSVWREKTGRVLLAIPAKVRGNKGPGDTVSVGLSLRS